SKEHLRKKIYAVTSSVGPGSANLVTASATALANNLPVLFLPGDTFASRQPDPVLQQVEQEHSASITTNDALKPVSRYWDRVERPEQLMSALLHAFEVMTNPATAGPVTISIAQDVEGETFDYAASFFEKRIHYVDRVLPSEEALTRAVTAIKAAKKPLIVVGGGAKYSAAGKAMVDCLEKYVVGLAETQAGKSTVIADHPYNMGGLGVTGTLSANKAAKSADLIIGIGTRYTDFTTSSKTAFNYDNAKFININVNRMQSYKMDAMQLVGDAKKTVQSLDKQQEWEDERKRLASIEIDLDNEAYEPEIKDALDKERLKEYRETLDTNYAQTTALIKLNELIDPSSYVVTSAGALPGDMHRVWKPG